MPESFGDVWEWAVGGDLAFAALSALIGDDCVWVLIGNPVDFDLKFISHV